MHVNMSRIEVGYQSPDVKHGGSTWHWKYNEGTYIARWILTISEVLRWLRRIWVTCNHTQRSMLTCPITLVTWKGVHKLALAALEPATSIHVDVGSWAAISIPFSASCSEKWALSFDIYHTKPHQLHDIYILWVLANIKFKTVRLL